QVVPAGSFPELFGQAKDPDQTEAAVLAIENSIAGSILGNYKLLQDSDLVVIGEVFLRIQQNLLVLPGVLIEELEEVHSHPMALAQCAEFFKTHPQIRLVESEDTAASAERLKKENLRNTGAIASLLAGEMYGLEVLAAGIEDNPVNFTRFLAVQRRDLAAPVHGANKVSVSFIASHQPGSLSRILAMLAAQSANLTKIQSVPLLGRAWEYRFFVDFSVRNPAILPATLRLLSAMTTDCNVLGIYRAAKENYE
ncbi:MAG: prephenate dehydratase, partial [Saprospiraceae bacterium]